MVKQIIAGGLGYVGRAVHGLFPSADVYDPCGSRVAKETFYKDQTATCFLFDLPPDDNYDVCHIAVNTPMSPDGSADISAVEDVLQKIKADLYIVHSTIPPGTVDFLEGNYSKQEWEQNPNTLEIKITENIKNIVFQPEYCASDAIYPQPLADMKKMPFLILGGRPENIKKARRLYEKVYPPTIEIYEVDAKTAETIKYFENAAIANKVVFCGEMFHVCQAFEVDYDKVRYGVFHLDPRQSDWWTLSEGKGYKSKCLDKDIPAIIHASEKAGYNPEFLKSVVKSNERFKNG